MLQEFTLCAAHWLTRSSDGVIHSRISQKKVSLQSDSCMQTNTLCTIINGPEDVAPTIWISIYTRAPGFGATGGRRDPHRGTALRHSRGPSAFQGLALVPRSGTKILVPRSWYQDLVPRSWYQDLGTKISVPRSWYQDIGTKILAPRYWYQDLSTKILLPRSR